MRLMLRTYRAAQHLYPRRFRLEYGDDMVDLLRDQLRDEPTWRVAGRTLIDLAVTVPVTQVEVHMPRSRTPMLVLVAGLLAAVATFTFVEGLLGVAVALLGVALAALIWRRERPARERGVVTAKWWIFLVGGAGLLAIVIGAASAAGELSEPAWVIAMIGLLTSVALVGAGILLGIIHLTDRHNSAGVAA
jgi:hypothetical protein